jgi:hypothetical protein
LWLLLLLLALEPELLLLLLLLLLALELEPCGVGSLFEDRTDSGGLGAGDVSLPPSYSESCCRMLRLLMLATLLPLLPLRPGDEEDEVKKVESVLPPPLPPPMGGSLALGGVSVLDPIPNVPPAHRSPPPPPESSLKAGLPRTVSFCAMGRCCLPVPALPLPLLFRLLLLLLLLPSKEKNSPSAAFWIVLGLLVWRPEPKELVL